MSEIALHPTSANCVTCVPDLFIDKYMVDANGEYVKIYLYLLRSLGRITQGLSISMIAEALDHTQKDIRKALHYWERQGLLELLYDDYDELSCIYLRTPDDPAFSNCDPCPETKVVSFPYKTDESLKELLYVAEKLLGHPLNPDAVDKIIYWHDQLNLSWELIEYIISYSVDKGAPSVNYMEKIALGYAKEGIKSIDEAKNQNSAFLSVSNVIKNAFGISGRNLGQVELEYANKWSKQYGFNDKIIEEACKRTILKIHTASFEYADSILSRWHELNVSDFKDIESLDREHVLRNKEVRQQTFTKQKKEHNFPERNDIDFIKLEKKLLNS